MSPKAMLLPVTMFTNLNSEPDLQGIAWLVAKFSKLLETSSFKKNVLPILIDNYLTLSGPSFLKLPSPQGQIFLDLESVLQPTVHFV